MGLENLYIDYGISTAPDGHKHYREGWLNIPCPHCTGSEGFHLGFNTDGNYFYCWRCGFHPINKTIAILLNIRYKQASSIAGEYGVRGGKVSSRTNHLIRINRKAFKYPSGVYKMSNAHRWYLTKRNFDPDLIEKQWDVLGTSPTSKLDDTFYKYRILVPIYWKHDLVSFQCRDYTNKQTLKYMACPMEREIKHHKHIVYGDFNHLGGVGICVEGVFDVWRLGPEAFATLGIGYTIEQVRLIGDFYTKVFIVFDPDKQAQEAGKKLQEELQFRGVKAVNYKELKCDPADLSEDDAKHLLRELNITPRMVSVSSSS